MARITAYVGDIAIETDKQMRPRDKDDFYETDPKLIKAYLTQYPLRNYFNVFLDPGCGTGSYGRAIRGLYSNSTIIGVEKNVERYEEQLAVDNPYTNVIREDYLDFNSGEFTYHCVIGNPPYKYAEEFLHKSISILHGNGTVDFLLRLAFLESERRYESLWTRGLVPTTVTVLNTRPSFTGDGKTYPTAFAFFRWDFIGGRCIQHGKLNFLKYGRKD